MFPKKMRCIMDGDCEKVWITDSWNNGDYDLNFIVKLEYLDEFMGDEAPAKYGVSVSAVSAEAAGPENVKAAIESTFGKDSAEGDELAYALLSYGVYASLFSATGNNSRQLLKTAKSKLVELSFLFGFAMDRPVNRIGATGWDAIAGNMARPMLQA